MIAGILALLMQATVTPEAPPATLPPDAITQPRWLRRPTGNDMARTYPRPAMNRDLSGRVTLQCIVTTEGTLDACQVADEIPANEGFGQAAQVLSRGFKMEPQDGAGVPTAGRPIRIPIRWITPDAGTFGPFRLQSATLKGGVDVSCRYANARFDDCLVMRTDPANPDLRAAVRAYLATMPPPPASAFRGRVLLRFEVAPAE